MNKKLVTLFLILTILPVGLLSWLGIVSVRTEKERDRQYFEELAAERLENVNLQIENYFTALEAELLSLPDFASMHVDEIREDMRESEIIRQVFILSGDGALVYPSEDIPISSRERDFLVRTKEIGLSRGVFTAGGEEESRFISHGWRTWYLGDGINFIFWRQADAEGDARQAPNRTGIVGIELNRMAVISGIIGVLPDTPPDGEQDLRITLTDVNGMVIYQWGGYEPGENAEAWSAVSAVEPIGSWRLRYFAPQAAVDSTGTRSIVIIASISFVALAVIGLAVYLFRESRREARDAFQKVTFVNQVSHELKTPLTNIRMYAELLEEQIPEDEERPRSYLDVVVSESRRLSRLIGNVLTFAKDRKKGIALNAAPAVPDKIIQKVVENFSPSLEAREIVVDLDLDCGAEVSLDTDVLEQILSNLISNVEKYAASGGSLAVRSVCRNGDVEITVKDKGPGIPRALRNKVFKPFYRMSNRLSDGVSGTGIGLSIVRMLAELHGGSASLLPSQEGAVFKVVIRRSRSARPAEVNHENSGC
jgi:signal transduction histidine kinase